MKREHARKHTAHTAIVYEKRLRRIEIIIIYLTRYILFICGERTMPAPFAPHNVHTYSMVFDIIFFVSLHLIYFLFFSVGRRSSGRVGRLTGARKENPYVSSVLSIRRES